MKTKRVHERLAGLLRRRIVRTLKPGDRLDKLADMASQFKVSVNSLRAALSVLGEEGLVESRQGSGVYVADYRRNLPVGVVCELDISYPGQSGFWLSLIQHIRRQLRERSLPERTYLGHTLPSNPIRGGLERPTCLDFFDDLRNDRLRGVISVGKLLHPDYEKAFRDHPVPAVNTGFAAAPGLATNRDQVIAATIRRLVAGGRRRIAVLACGYRSHLSEEPTPVAETLRELGVEIPEKWIRDDLHPVVANGAGWEEFREIWSASREKPDALLVLDDLLFKDAALAITELNIAVPEQLHVTVHVNRGNEPYSPFPIDRIVMDPERYATRLVDNLESKLEGGCEAPETLECVSAEYGVPIATAARKHLVV